MKIEISNISEHPELKAFIDSESPDIVINAHKKYAYRVRLSNSEIAPDVTLFTAACIYGKVNHVCTLYQDIEEIKSAIRAKDYRAYIFSVKNGHTEILRYLETYLTDAEKKEAVKAGHYAVIRATAENGHTKTLQHLETHLTDAEIKEAVKADNYLAISLAAANGHTKTLQHLETYLTDAEKKEAANYTISEAAKYGHAATLLHLETHLTDTEKKKVVTAQNYKVIIETAANGHMKTLLHLEKHLAAAEKKEAVKAWDYGSILMVAKNGHTKTLRYIEKHLMDADKKEAVKAKNYEAIHNAVENGHMRILQRLETYLSGDEKKEAVKADNYRAILKAAQNGRMRTLLHLETHLENADKKEAVKIANYDAIRKAAQNGHMTTLRHLEKHLTDAEKKEAVKVDNYDVIRMAAARGHTTTLQHIETHLTDAEKKEAVMAVGYDAFYKAATRGRTATLQHLETHLTDAEKKEAVMAFNYHVIRNTAYNTHTATLYHLFKIDIALAYAEMHVSEFGSVVLSYVQQTLASLKDAKLKLETDFPNAVFDVPEDEARCLYYMARHLIRLNSTEYRDDLLFFLEIPQVKRLAHQRLNNGQENELLRLALDSGNQTAAQLLLAIPAVNDLARANDYYRAESQGQLDLRALAANRESSMTALTQGEQQRLAQAIGHYEPFIQSAGVVNIIHDLRETLKSRYEEKPACILKDNGEALELPLLYSDFVQLQLSNNEKQQALRAYYQHQDHTAIRYLSVPNDWMSPQAAFVYVNDARTQRWSTFEEYQPLIAMFYCAARDENIPAIDGFTFETRLEHFIDELAHIGRAHNWDRTRQAANGDLEAYDDLEGDKPSCFSGVKRRLFQSVLGHPMLVMLTEEKVEAEVNAFARAYFLARITDANREAVLDALNKVIALEELTDEDKHVLAETDISKEKYNQFIEFMSRKYGIQFTSEPRFSILIQQAMREKHGHCAHLLNFGSVMRSILTPTQNSPALTSEIGLFSSSESPDDSVRALESQNLRRKDL